MTETVLHPEFAANGSFAHLPLGKQPPKVDPRTLKLAKYLDPTALPPIPDAIDYSGPVTSWPMYGNDRLGDCTCAAVGHMIQAWSANAGGVAKTFSDADVELLYWETGTPPSSSGEAGGPTDTGRMELDVLNYWRKTGIGQPEYADRILVYAAIDPSNIEHLKAAIYLFGGVYIGLALPKTAQGQSEWTVVGDGETGDSQPGSWGGHAVDIVGYGDGKLKIVTWGATLEMTEDFWRAYGDEAYAIVTPDWVAANGLTVPGLDLATLEQDLAAIDAPTQGAETSEGQTDRLTLPTFPWEIALTNARVWIQVLSDGSALMKLAPAMSTPVGEMPIPPGIGLAFDADAWQGFKRFVEADGNVTQVQTATAVPMPPTGFLRR